MYFPWHAQRGALSSSAFLHLHFPEHFFLQPHLINSLQAKLASSRSVQWICQLECSFSRFQPYKDGDGSCWLVVNDWPHTSPAWYADLLICWKRAPQVGGILSSILVPDEKSICLASLTFFTSNVLSYMQTTKLSSCWTSDSEISSNLQESFLKTSVMLGKTFHADQAVFFPMLQKADVVSHPVSAWNIGKPWHFAGLRTCTIWCTGIAQLPVPYSTHNSIQPTFWKYIES